MPSRVSGCAFMPNFQRVRAAYDQAFTVLGAPPGIARFHCGTGPRRRRAASSCGAPVQAVPGTGRCGRRFRASRRHRGCRATFRIESRISSAAAVSSSTPVSRRPSRAAFSAGVADHAVHPAARQAAQAASNVAACFQILTKASCTMSSARARSPRMRWATPSRRAPSWR